MTTQEKINKIMEIIAESKETDIGQRAIAVVYAFLSKALSTQN